ncbi:MAG: PqqD family protein, partial [Halobacteriota archaeon]|nr:PqqD family protein [Halobacteriota archaeon]
MNPQRSTGIDLKRFDNEDEVYFIARDEKSGEYFRFSEPEAFIWDKLDGDHTVESIVRMVKERFGEITVESLEEYLKGLECNGLIKGDYYRSKYPDDENMVNKVSDRFSDLLSIKFPMIHPDELCDSLYKYFGWVISRWMAPLYIAIIVAGIVIFFQNYATFTSAETIRVWDSGYLGVLILFVISIPMMIIHEFGHALACKKFNRHVWEMGFMLYL